MSPVLPGNAMPRRALKSPEELRELILSEARNIIEEHGTYTLSAREIAKAINYSPGTLYNAFKNIDDIKWGVETNIL
ncbi:MAG: TetR/AcrR family transcriptional regulator, partial [Pseudomonadota bacterium]